MTAPIRVLAQPAFARRELNPYTWQLATGLAAAGASVRGFTRRELLRGTVDIWHVHWPDSHLDEAFPLACRRSLGVPSWLRLGRARGARLVWTIHNLRAHECRHPVLARWFRRVFIPQVDGVISLSRRGDAAAVERYPRLADVPRFVIPHGDYRRVYPNDVGRDAARARLGIAPSVPVIAFVGLIREYKNVPALIGVVRRLARRDVVLLVAGRPATPRIEEQVRLAAASDPRVRLHLGLIREGEMQLFLNAADLVVLPYREILNSGAALLALSFDRPVLLPDAGALPELQEHVGSDWVRLYQGELTPAQLDAAVAWAVAGGRAGRAPLAAYDWDTITAATLAAYREVLAV